MNIVVLSVSELAEIIRTNVREALTELPVSASLDSRPLSADGAAHYLGIPKATLYQLTSSREIPHKKLGKRLVFLTRELDDWIATKHKMTRSEAAAIKIHGKGNGGVR